MPRIKSPAYPASYCIRLCSFFVKVTRYGAVQLCGSLDMQAPSQNSWNTVGKHKTPSHDSGQKICHRCNSLRNSHT